jgi:hypothetical protein
MFDPAGEFDRPAAVATASAPALRVKAPEEAEPLRPAVGAPELVWQGIFTGWSGYAKASREIMLRLANTFRISAVHIFEPPGADPYVLARVNTHRRVAVSDAAPMVRLFGPDPVGEDGRHRIVWTMMETETIHRDMVAKIEAHYHEVWTPTHWNAETLRRSGVRVPVRVMPLGTSNLVYRPGPREPLPVCTLLTGPDAGFRERPEGFLFVYVCLPSFRKGLDVLVPAFHEAFGGDPETALVVAVTHGGEGDCPQLGLDPEGPARVYSLTGEYTEHEMARIYRGCDAYACASRGEGWNLPMMEAAGCGLPVIAPRNTSHLELLDDDTAFLFDCEGFAPFEGAESVSKWYEGQDFAVFGKRSHRQLVEQLRRVRKDPEAPIIAARFANRVRTRWTWEAAAARAAERLLELAG